MTIPGLTLTRRSFLLATGTTAAATLLPLTPSALADDSKPASEINILGPKPGYTPQIGTLVSMLTWMRRAPLGEAHGLTQPQLDWLFDANANAIGALLLHLAATETIYQRLTFDNVPYQKLEDPSGDYDKHWGAAMNLGERGRKEIKGHDLAYYTAILAEVREKSLAEFKKRDDAWLLSVDKTWGWGPTNNYCKWFHVCEHESHHSGQIALLAKRVPGAKPSSEGL